MNTNLYAAIILAAGFSNRMGFFKPLLRLGEETMVERVISLYQQNNVDTFVITGWKGHELKESIKKNDVIFCENPDYVKGMFSSVKAGVSNLKNRYKGFFIMPVDVPLVRPSTIKKLLDSAALQPQSIIYPVFNAHRGHPTLIPANFIPEILSHDVNSSLRDILNMQKEKIVDIKVADQNILFDLDSPEDYQLASQKVRSHGLPSRDECEVIFNICEVPSEVRNHGQKVSEIACKIGQAVLKTGKSVNMDVIFSAALLHDVAKGKKKHDLAGGQILMDLGFDKIAEVISIHTDLPEENRDIPLETKIVFLADKLVKEDLVVSLDERYSASNRPFDVTPDIEAKIRQRKSRAENVKREIEALLGHSILST